MKRSLIGTCLLTLVAACSTDDLTQPTGNGGGGSPVSTAGTDSGGTPASSSGASSGGMSAGGTSMGGAGGTSMGGAGGTSMGGAGGTGMGGAGGTSMGGAGGTSMGGAGGTGMGGATAGTGTGGTAGGTGGGGNLVTTVAGKLDGFLFVAPCGDGGTGYDCLNSAVVPAPQNSPACQNQQPKNTTVDIAIGGDPGKIYDVTIHVYGVVEAKNYQGGMRRDGNNMNASATGGDFWYVGGTAPNSSYNTYELHVTPKVEGAANDYFLNSRNGTGEGHESWALNYTATIPVTGGGKVNFRVYDSNCRQIMNCGPGTGSSKCAAPRQLDLSATDPKPPATFTQPFVGGAPGGATGQWVFIDVTSVVAR